MLDMQLSNDKLVDRGIRMLVQELQISTFEAADLLKKIRQRENSH